MQLILGSTSPRRKEILEMFTLPFKQVGSSYDETEILESEDVYTYTCTLAKKKAETIHLSYPEEIILTADTVVFFQNRIYSKPKDKKEAFRMLSELSGNEHQVVTGVCVQSKDHQFSGYEVTKVLFNKLTEKQINTYHNHFYFEDKAGGYAIQKAGYILIKKIDGCFYNVMGLPINCTRELLAKVGIDLWDYLKF